MNISTAASDNSLTDSGYSLVMAMPLWITELISSAGDDFFQRLVDDIDAGQSSIDLESYIVEDDAVGQLVIAALVRADQRGVAVRLLVDGLGAAHWIAGVGRRFRACPWRVYHPLPWTILGNYVPSLYALQSRHSGFNFINRRNHRKVCIIDGSIAWVGSCNLEARHSRLAVGERAWRDTAARVTGPQVQHLTAAFNHTWRQSWRYGDRHLFPAINLRGSNPQLAKDVPVRLNTVRSLRRRLWRDLLLRISRAETRVWITVPYFVPNPDLLRALELAARRADVRLLLPLVNDVPFMPWIAGLYVERLQRAGIRIWAYPRMVHAKTKIIDDLGLVGSSNLNSRSLVHDLEADVWLSQPTSLAALTSSFLADCATAQLVAPGARLSWWKRWLGSTILLMRRWL